MDNVDMTQKCGFRATTDDDGGAQVTLFVPTVEGEAEFTVLAERDEDGDWRVFIPWFHHDDNPARDHIDLLLSNGYTVTNGVCHLAAPEANCEGCHGSDIPGVRWPAETNCDASRPWVEKCDTCDIFENDMTAFFAVINDGAIRRRIVEIGLAVPKGCTSEQPYVVAEED